jgi:hypothetical protein
MIQQSGREVQNRNDSLSGSQNVSAINWEETTHNLSGAEIVNETAKCFSASPQKPFPQTPSKP